MEIINKKHEDIIANRRTNALAYLNFLQDGKGILFSTKAVVSFGICAGMFAHFINDDDRWYVIFNTDKDGFEIFEKKTKRNLFVHNSHLVNLFLKRTKRSLPCKCVLKIADAKIKGCQLIELDLKNIF